MNKNQEICFNNAILSLGNNLLKYKKVKNFYFILEKWLKMD